ncbi:MAG: hypothetical protein HGGPFJEG_00530 [Ignavibacteria bacterium]|nr:hypothetical protein [Ignavibacteria bacterium]
MIRYFTSFCLTALLFYLNSCSDPTSGKIENLPPDTYLSLRPDSIIAPGTTLKTIRWWGDDPDGFIKGYYISFDSLNWNYTTQNDSTFALHITGNDSTFRFYVAAIDEQDLIDPTPATNLYPVENSAPSVVFDAGTEIPDTTFPIATFKWTGSDTDGVANIKYYQWAINDTNNFRRIPGSVNLLTLTKDSGLVTDADNIFYLRAEDDAGALSPVIRMPDTSRHWHVRNNTSKILLIKDMPLSQFGIANSYFESALDTISYDVLDIKSNNGALIPKIVNPMFTETLKLFEIVIWSANQGNASTDNANFELGQNSLPFYLQSGGKLFFTTGLPNAETQGQGTLINWAPIDSISSCTIGFVSGNVSLINEDNSYPVLITTPGGLFIQRVRGIKSTEPTRIIYRLPISTVCQTNTVVAVKNSASNPNNILMTMPVYYINADVNASKQLFDKILIQEFGYR